MPRRWATCRAVRPSAIPCKICRRRWTGRAATPAKRRGPRTLGTCAHLLLTDPPEKPRVSRNHTIVWLADISPQQVFFRSSPVRPALRGSGWPTGPPLTMHPAGGPDHELTQAHPRAGRGGRADHAGRAGQRPGGHPGHRRLLGVRLGERPGWDGPAGRGSRNGAQPSVPARVQGEAGHLPPRQVGAGRHQTLHSDPAAAAQGPVHRAARAAAPGHGQGRGQGRSPG